MLCIGSQSNSCGHNRWEENHPEIAEYLLKSAESQSQQDSTFQSTIAYTFAQAEQQREAQDLISAENLNAEAARRYITTSLKREFASDSGTELNAVLPKMSPLNPQYLTKKQSVFQKIAAFVEKFKGVGGQV